MEADSGIIYHFGLLQKKKMMKKFPFFIYLTIIIIITFYIIWVLRPFLCFFFYHLFKFLFCLISIIFSIIWLIWVTLNIFLFIFVQQFYFSLCYQQRLIINQFPKCKSVRSRSGPVPAERPVFLGPDRTGPD